MSSATSTTPDYTAIKTKQQATWSSGHYSKIGSLLQISGERLIDAMSPRPGSSFLDVAAGNGNLTLAAARRFLKVVSTDYVASSLEDGRARARANGFDIAFRTADCEALPFDDGSFDYVGSTYGVMFTANQEQAASELARVCRPGGRIGMANWTPDGFLGALFQVIGRFNPPPTGLHPPARWGTEAFLEEQFGPTAAAIDVRRRTFPFCYLSAEHFLQWMAEWYGPILKALDAQTPERRTEMKQAVIDLFNQHNVATDGSLRIDAEYLEVVITKG